MTKKISTGGCHCGAVRYEVRGESIWKSMCFCHSCTRAVGAPVVAWAGFSKVNFNLIRGTITKYHSSDKGVRGFCSRCGTSLTYEKRAEYREVQSGGSRPDQIFVTTFSLDDPVNHPPEDYVYLEEKVDWLEAGVSLPQHEFTPADRER